MNHLTSLENQPLADDLPTTLHVLLVDDHALFRRGMQLLVQSIEGVACVLDAGSVDQALLLAHSDAGRKVNVLLLDIQMPSTSGLEGIAVLRLHYPQAKVLMLSGNDAADAAPKARRLGAHGFLSKTAPAEAVQAALRGIHAGGGFYTEAGVRLPAVAPPGSTPQLSPRQTQVLVYVAQGKSNKLIARELDMSENTVRSHLTAVFLALGVTSRTGAVLVGQRCGLV